MPVRVYGFIESFNNQTQDEHNLEQIRLLPSKGAYLTNFLFSLVPYSRGYAYYGSHIHFAAGYKDLYCLDSEWIEEFERLLLQLYWHKAEVTLTWSQERYIWVSDFSTHTPQKSPSKILKRTRLESAWNLKEIQWDS